MSTAQIVPYSFQNHATVTQLGSFYLLVSTKSYQSIYKFYTQNSVQRNLVSDSPNFIIKLMYNSILNLCDGQKKFFEEFKLQNNGEINSAHQKVFGDSWNGIWACKC